MIKFILVCLIAFVAYKLAKPLMEFVALVLLVFFVSYGVSEYAEDIINYFNQLYVHLIS